MTRSIAKIAVNAATYFIDQPYDYLIPDELKDSISPGCRVLVPFSRGNKIIEGIVLSIYEGVVEENTKLKSIISQIDLNPILTENQIQLAIFMHDRYFCTVYDAVKSMLPVGLWLKDDGSVRVKEKMQEMVSILVSSDEVDAIISTQFSKAKQQANLLRELSVFGQLPSRELLLFTGASRKSLKSLADNGYVEIFKQEVFRRPDFKTGDKRDFPVLNNEQHSIFKDIVKITESDNFNVTLLQGVTGSGKTAIYIHLINNVLNKGKSAILLVPEIALTPQMLKTFSSFFGDDIAVLHSSLSFGERNDEWLRVKTGKAHLTIGTRSAIFSPCSDLGLIIIDEEQEDSYKSDINPRYDAVEIAKYRCFKSNCTLLLGSATPQICSKYNAKIGKYNYFELNTRYNRQKLPHVEIVDMKEDMRDGNSYTISNYLRDEIQLNIDNGEQTILFLNRRGANRLVICSKCGFTYKCPNCSVSLTYHSVNNRLRCHYCDYSQPLDSACPKCGGHLKKIGAGTQLVEHELHEMFPGVEIIRMDADVINKTSTHEKLFDKFREEKVPILIGTQMVTKGLNFENVTLVGVLSADSSLYVNDYKSTERTFSLITQVIGRSGRGSKTGRAVIQTFTPQNDTLVLASNQDYNNFYESEIDLRKQQKVPPFYDLISISVTGLNEKDVLNASNFVKLRLKYLLDLKNLHDYILLGPSPYNIVKINNRYRYRVILKCHLSKSIRDTVALIVKECSKNKDFKGLSFFAQNNPEE